MRIKIIILLMVPLVVGGCGQMGELYLPDKARLSNQANEWHLIATNIAVFTRFLYLGILYA